MKKYNPLQHSVIQAISGEQYLQYETEEFHFALLKGIMDEIERVYWNRNQIKWDEYNNPNIPNIIWNSYDWNQESKAPNFQYKDVCFNWYKYPGRGMSTNKNWSGSKWKIWFDDCIHNIQSFDTQSCKGEKK